MQMMPLEDSMLNEISQTQLSNIACSPSLFYEVVQLKQFFKLKKIEMLMCIGVILLLKD